MKISTKGRYGVRIMLELALHNGEEMLTVKTIAKEQGISEKYIEQIISMLHKNGLVSSKRGAQGGYKLSGSPSGITVGQILRVTECGLDLVDCTKRGTELCSRQQRCVTSDVWKRMSLAVEDVADHISLADLVEEHKQKNKD